MSIPEILKPTAFKGTMHPRAPGANEEKEVAHRHRTAQHQGTWGHLTQSMRRQKEGFTSVGVSAIGAHMQLIGAGEKAWAKERCG